MLGLAALVVGLLTPPYQSPDSYDHLRRAAAIASGQWVLTTPPGGKSSGAVVDTGLQAHMALFEPLAHQPERKVDAATAEQAARIGFSGRSAFVVTPGTGPYAPPIYAVHALAWKVGQALGLTVGAAYRLVQASVLLACLGVLGAAWRIVAPTPLTFALLALPMTIFQLGSPTIDGLCTALLLLWLAVYVRGLDEPSDAAAAPPARASSLLRQDALLVVLAAVLVTCRFQMWPLLLLLAHRAWRRRSVGLFVAAVVCAVAIAAWLGWAMSHTVDGRVVRTHTTGQIARLYMDRPAEFLSVLGQTIVFRSASYLRSFIGVLGWMDTAFRLPIYGLLAATLVAIVVIIGDAFVVVVVGGMGSIPGAYVAALLIAGAGLSGLTVLLAMMLTWTPYPAVDLIKGIQGRYFLPAALMLAAVDWPSRRGPTHRGRAWAVAVGLLGFGVGVTWLLLVERYSPDIAWSPWIMDPVPWPWR